MLQIYCLEPYVYPAWSPDGKKIAYGGPSGDAVEIFVCDADGTGQKQLTRLGGMSSMAAWSRDGKRIAFQHHTYRSALASLYVMDADGGNLTVVLKDAGPKEGGRPVWKRKVD